MVLSISYHSKSYYDSFRKPPSWPNGAPKFVEDCFLSLMPALSKSAWTLSSRPTSFERGAVAEVVGLSAFDEKSEGKLCWVMRLLGAAFGASLLPLLETLALRD